MSAEAAEALERPACALCGPGPEQRVRHEFAPYAVVCCTGCGLLFLSPRPSAARALALYQDPAYYESPTAGHGYDEYLELQRSWVRTFTRRLRRIARHQPGPRVLDVGCGPGFFLDAASALGFEAWGIDPSAYAVGLARQRHGERVVTGLIESAALPAEAFDLLVAGDAFEHVYDPLGFLAAADRLLKPRGLVAVTTPDPSSLLARLSGRGWVSFKIPEHVYYWSPATIRRALEPRFQVLEVSSAGQYASVGFLLRRLLRVGARPSRGLRRVLDALNRLSVYANNGSLTVVGRKRSGAASGGGR